MIILESDKYVKEYTRSDNVILMVTIFNYLSQLSNSLSICRSIYIYVIINDVCTENICFYARIHL